MKDYKNLLIFLLPYFTLCGALYHISFWNEFGFNGLQFVDVIDLFKIAAPSIFPTLILAIFLTLFNAYSPSGSAFALEPGAGRNSKVGRFLNRDWVKHILILLWFYIVSYMVFHWTDPHRWISATFIFAIPISILLTSKPFVIELIPDYKMRNFVILCLIYIPCFCYGRAKEEAENISKSIEFKYILKPANTMKFKPDTLKYLGIADDKLIFTDKTNKNIVFIKLADTTILNYKNNKTPYRGFVSEIKSLFFYFFKDIDFVYFYIFL